VGIDTVLSPSYFTIADMETQNLDFAKGWLVKAQAFMTENKRKPRKAEIYQIFIDTYMEN